MGRSSLTGQRERRVHEIEEAHSYRTEEKGGECRVGASVRRPAFCRKADDGPLELLSCSVHEYVHVLVAAGIGRVGINLTKLETWRLSVPLSCF